MSSRKRTESQRLSDSSKEILTNERPPKKRKQEKEVIQTLKEAKDAGCVIGTGKVVKRKKNLEFISSPNLKKCKKNWDYDVDEILKSLVSPSIWRFLARRVTSNLRKKRKSKKSLLYTHRDVKADELKTYFFTFWLMSLEVAPNGNLKKRLLFLKSKGFLIFQNFS